MRPQRTLVKHGWLEIGLALLTACGAAPGEVLRTPGVVPTAAPLSPSPLHSTEPPVPPSTPTPAEPLPIQVIDFPQAQSVSVVSAGEGTLYVILGQEHRLEIARSTDGGRTFSDAVLATGDQAAHVLPIERPAIAASQTGKVGLAWVEIPADYNGGQIWYAFSEDGGQTFSPGQLVATDRSGETTMVELALDDAGNPLLTWLNDSRLQFTRSSDQGLTFASPQSIGDGACECCQPHSLTIDDHVYIVYRSLEPAPEAGDIRDIVLIRSADGGQTFEPVTRVSDTHWYLSACPIAGPALAAHAGDLYVAWMDDRFAPPGTFNRGDVWLARSDDGGQSFSTNVRINSDQSLHHTKPAIGVGPDGRVHVAWEAQDATSAVLYYTHSEDGGQTFAPPQVIASNADGARGRPRMSVLVVSPAGQVALAWIDRLGAHLALWPGRD